MVTALAEKLHALSAGAAIRHHWVQHLWQWISRHINFG